MSWLITAAVVAGVTTARMQSNAGKADEIGMEKAAEQEKLSSEARELGRRQQLNKALAANIVGISTSGMSGEGTPQSIALGNAKTASISEGLEGLSSRLKQAQMIRQGKQAKSTSNLQAASTLLNTSVKAGQLGG